MTHNQYMQLYPEHRGPNLIWLYALILIGIAMALNACSSLKAWGTEDFPPQHHEADRILIFAYTESGDSMMALIDDINVDVFMSEVYWAVCFEDYEYCVNDALEVTDRNSQGTKFRNDELGLRIKYNPVQHYVVIKEQKTFTSKREGEWQRYVPVYSIYGLRPRE